MIPRKGSERELKQKLNNYRQARDSACMREIRQKKYYEDKRAREEKNKNALLFYIDTLQEEFSPKQFEVMAPVFDVWKKHKYAREPLLAHHDVRKVLIVVLPKEEIEERLAKCQEKLKNYLDK